jgi:hypothetical protein
MTTTSSSRAADGRDCKFSVKSSLVRRISVWYTGLYRGETRSVKIGRGVRQGCCLSHFLFNLYSECFTKEALEGFGDFKLGAQIIHTVKYADGLVLLLKEEKVLQDMIDKLIEIGRCYGMEINVEKTKVMRTSRQLFPVKIMIHQKD